MYDLDKELKSLKLEVKRIKGNLEAYAEMEHRGINLSPTLKTASRPYVESAENPSTPTAHRVVPLRPGTTQAPPKYLEVIERIGVGEAGTRRYLEPNPAFRRWELQEAEALRHATAIPDAKQFMNHEVPAPREPIVTEPTRGGLRSVVDAVDELTSALTAIRGKK